MMRTRANYKINLNSILMYIAAIVCVGAGIFVSFNQTYQTLQPYNYLLGPVGDGATDAAEVTYPILTHKASLSLLFKPFADHRIVVERLMVFYDFYFHQGLDEIHPLRFIIVTWLTLGLLSAVLFVNKVFPLSLKFLFIGVAAVLLFAGINNTNATMPITLTWPLVILFSVLCFMLLARYCDLIRKNGSGALRILFLVSLFVILTIYSFNIGLILWPIIFIVLWKRQALQPHFFLWLLIAVLSYGVYLSNAWHPGITATDGGMKLSLLHPLHPFLYLSRLLSIPLVRDAMTTTSVWSISIGFILISSSICFLYRFWRISQWHAFETIIFSLLLFSFVTLSLIPIMRSWIPGEYAGIGTRFMLISFMLWWTLLVSYFLFLYQNQVYLGTWKQSMPAFLAALVLTLVFIPHDDHAFHITYANPFFIAFYPIHLYNFNLPIKI